MVRCPRCGSGSVKKSSAIYEQGISRSEGRSSGVWLSRGNLGVWGGRSSRESISGAAARNAPTGFELEILTLFGVFFVALLIGLFSAGSIGAFLMAFPISFLIACVAAIIVAILQKNSRASARAQYDRQWYCSKCGGTFEVDLNKVRSESPDDAVRAGPADRTGIGCSPADYASRILYPVQRAKSETVRDGSWLLTIAARAGDKDRSFDPCLPSALDLGAVSRLASLGFLQYDEQTKVFSISEKGAEQLRKRL